MSIKQCKCANDFQDKEHGKGMRVHTESKEGIERCTVCGGKARWQERLDIHAKNHIKQVHG